MSHSADVEKHYEVRGWYSTVQEIRHDGWQFFDVLFFFFMLTKGIADILH